MKLGQRAMIAAKVRHLDLSFNDKSRIEFAKETKVSSGYIGQASIVLKWAADQADAVISGAIALNDAYKEAQDRKRAGTALSRECNCTVDFLPYRSASIAPTDIQSRLGLDE
jgi:hypothetical protein